MIEILSVSGLSTVQDGGRPGRMHEGVPPGGALVPELLARANARAGNADAEAAIEVFGALAVAARGAAVILGTDAGDTVTLGDGETRTLAPPAASRVHYVAVRGGFDVPVVLGGRGTLLVASLGGHEGRPLRRGDRLAVGASPARDHRAPPAPAAPDREAAIRVVLGPDLDRFDPRAVAALRGAAFLVDARSDRVGIRLGGGRLEARPDPAAVSAPMVRGAIQVPPSGEPIVLGPDHPTTGGYPVIAVVARDHFGSLAARPIGTHIHFVT